MEQCVEIFGTSGSLFTKNVVTQLRDNLYSQHKDKNERVLHSGGPRSFSKTSPYMPLTQNILTMSTEHALHLSGPNRTSEEMEVFPRVTQLKMEGIST